jgi:tryptophan synthase beta chain
MAPLVCALYDQKVIEAVAVHQNPTFEAALTFARAEGFLPAPEAAHAIRVVIDEALRCKQAGQRKVIAFNFCGHGHFDLSAYERYLSGKLEDFEYPTEKVKEALAGLPAVKV